MPPVFSGYPTADRSRWAAFDAAYAAAHGDLHADFDAFVRGRGAPGLPGLDFMPESPYLNLYLYPAELDYRRQRPLPATWHRLDSCVREADTTFELPPQLATGDGRLIYLSLGSLGSADVELMQRLIDVLGRTEHRAIVSMGPQADLLELAAGMHGAEFLPQPSILPLVDLVITHGGNNTVCECLHHGKPTICLPLFWDQHDNAQRLDELGFGVRLATYGFDEPQLTRAIDRLCDDAGLTERLARIAARLQAAPGTDRAATLIERLASTGEPVRQAAETA